MRVMRLIADRSVHFFFVAGSAVVGSDRQEEAMYGWCPAAARTSDAVRAIKE
jgi:hypothetical protein